MDRLSQLTDDLLIKILSFVPTKEAVSMSILSKRWMSLWTLVPSLNFEELWVGDADEESFSRLIYCSSVLENLGVSSCIDDNVATFTINVPSLRSLAVWNGLFDSEINYHRFVIHSHSLNQLEIFDEYGEVNVMGKMHNLVEASLEIFETQGNALESLTHVKRLSLSLAGVVKFPIGSIFLQLVRLQFVGHDENWWNSLMPVLHHSPILQFLKLDWVEHEPNIWKLEEENKFCSIQPSCVGECLFSLKTFEWKRYAGTEQEKEVAIYILKKARRLVTATIVIADSVTTYLDTVELARKLKVFEELEFATRGSRSCELTMAERKNQL